jgi:RNA 2',3'-cyclic 3'-phosphodiesterase
MPRLFTAIELPEDVQDLLADLEQPLPGAKWVDTDNLHLTLRFFGDVNGGVMRELEAELNGVDTDAFEINLTGLGVFGGDDPKVLWAGVSANPSLDALARAHERAARNAGLPPEKRPFKAHVTLARLRGASPAQLASYLSQHAMFKTEPFFVSRAVLLSSKPLVGGGPYVIEATYPLRGGYDGDWDEDHAAENA